MSLHTVHNLSMILPPTFSLTVDGEDTDLLDRLATAGEVEAALEGLAAIGSGNVSVAGDDGGPYTVTFQGTLADEDVTDLITSFRGAIDISVSAEGEAAVDEVQTITVTATSGTFTLTYSGQTTGTLNYDDDSATIQAALIALSNIGATDVAVTGDGPHVVTFGNTLAATDVPLITVNDIDLDGGTVTVAETTKGNPPVDEVVVITLPGT